MKRVSSLITASLIVIGTIMSTIAFDVKECEPYIVMYAESAENDCFDGPAMQLALEMALPTLEGWAKATDEIPTSKGRGNSGENAANTDKNSTDTFGNSTDSIENSTNTSGNSDSNTATKTSSNTSSSPGQGQNGSPTTDSSVNNTRTDAHNTNDVPEIAGLDQTVGYMEGLENGYAMAVHVGFDEGYKEGIGSGDDRRALTVTPQGAGANRNQVYLDAYSNGFTVGYEEGYAVGFKLGECKGKYGSHGDYNHGYDDGQVAGPPIDVHNSTTGGGAGVRRWLKMLVEADDESSRLSHLRGNRNQQQRKTQTKAECKHMCFHSSKQKRQMCSVLGCFTKYPGLTARRRRRELQQVDGAGTNTEITGDDTATEEVIMSANNTVFQTVITADGIEGGLGFKNLIADLLQKTCNVSDVGFEVWLMCPDAQATDALANSTTTTSNSGFIR